MGKAAAIACDHCGTLFEPKSAHDRFCCAGCDFVSHLISENGMERFYQLKGSRVTTPVRGLVFEARDDAWLVESVKAAEGLAASLGENHAELCVDVQGMSCIGCVWLIEQVFKEQAGALRVEASPQEGRLKAWWVPGEFDFPGFSAELQQYGYGVGPAGANAENNRGESNQLVPRIGLCGAFAMNAMAFSLPRYFGMTGEFVMASMFQLIAAASATLALFAGGGYFFRRAFLGLRSGRIHVDLPISIGIIAAYAGSIVGWIAGVEELVYFDFVATFIFLMLLGRWLHEAALERNRNRLLESGLARRSTVTRIEEGRHEAVEFSRIESGDALELKPGQMVPVTSRMEEEAADFNLQAINGEAETRTWRRGHEVPAGAVFVGSSPLRLEALENFNESMLARLLDLSGSGEARDPVLERLLQRVLVAVLAIAFGGGFYWLLTGGGAAKALQVLVSILVVSCPCALGVALPMVNEIAAGFMQRVGLFVQRGSVWSRLRKVKRVVFDKTGTLTMETPDLVNGRDMVTLEPGDLEMLALMTARSLHPLSRALREQLAGVNMAEGEVEEVPGCGLLVEGGWSLGRPGWKSPTADNAGDEEMFVDLARSGKLKMRFRFEEAARPDAAVELRALRDDGYAIEILSGDRPESVRALAAELGLPPEAVHGGMTPDDKHDWLAAHDPESVLYLGDGTNDSLAFDIACCRGTPAVGGGVLEQKSDFYLLSRGIRPVRWLLKAARERARTVRLVVFLAFLYNVAVVAVCLGGWMSPLLAAILMPLSSIFLLALVVARRPRWSKSEHHRARGARQSGDIRATKLANEGV